MIKFSQIILLCVIANGVSTHIMADEKKTSQTQETKINLKHISGEDVASVLATLIDKSVSIKKENNTLTIIGPADKTKNILPIVDEIDTPPDSFTIEFIASNKKINFNKPNNTYESSKSLTNTSQSIAIIERQWVTLNTGLTIPISERKRLPDGTETQSFRYKKVAKSYLFKVHEFSGWSVIQVGITHESLTDDIAGAIQFTQLDTTIVGKTGEWLEIASRKPIYKNDNSNIYSTNQSQKQDIYLYVKVVSSKTIKEN